MPILDRITGQWKKTAKELEKEQTKVNLEAKIQEQQAKLEDQEQQLALLTLTLGDLMLGGL